MTKETKVYDAIIEISSNTPGGIKYEFDKEMKQLRVDRMMSTSMIYPCNYGFINNTLGGDGDPIDVLVHSTQPILPCSVVAVRIIGALITEDEKGMDHKVLSVPHHKIDPALSKINSYLDLHEIFLQKIEHFFKHYKDLEKGKFVKVIGWEDAEKAAKLVEDGIKQA